MIFEIICIDTKNKVKFREKRKFLDALTFNESLWKSQNLCKDEENFIITDDILNIIVKIETIDTSKVVTEIFTSAFIVK